MKKIVVEALQTQFEFQTVSLSTFHMLSDKDKQTVEKELVKAIENINKKGINCEQQLHWD